MFLSCVYVTQIIIHYLCLIHCCMPTLCFMCIVSPGWVGIYTIWRHCVLCVSCFVKLHTRLIYIYIYFFVSQIHCLPLVGLTSTTSTFLASMIDRNHIFMHTSNHFGPAVFCQSVLSHSLRLLSNVRRANWVAWCHRCSRQSTSDASRIRTWIPTIEQHAWWYCRRWCIG